MENIVKDFVSENEIVALLKHLFPDIEKVPVATSFTQSGLLSSMDLVNLVFEIENVFDLNFDLEKIDLGEFDSPIQIAETVNKARGSEKLTIRKLVDDIFTHNTGKDALTFNDVTYSYDTMYAQIKFLAAGFLEDGIGKGTHVVIILENSYEYILSYLALFYIGAIPVPINTRWHVDEVVKVVVDSDSEYFIVKKHQGTVVFSEVEAGLLQNQVKMKAVYYCDEDVPEGKKRFMDLMLDKAPELPPLCGEDIAMMSYTSGTTGSPKGVLLRHNNVTKISLYTAKIWADENDTPFSIAPLYSAQGFLSMLINIAVGSRFKMISSFNTNDILKEISKKDETIFHTQPTMWTMLLHSRAITFADFSKLEKIVVSGSLCSPELAKRIEERLQLRLMNAYGLIEGTSVATMTRFDDPEDVRRNTVGRPIPGVEIKIVDEHRNVVAHGEVGELAMRGYVMEGYYKNPQKTAETIDEEGWLYTGDLARFYDKENISIVGRCKDMVIRGGYNVYPSDIEEILLRIPEIQTAAVVGRPHEVLGEELVAFVVLRAGTSLKKVDISSYLFKNLANYKQPDHIYLISDMPTILAGKIDKKVLTAWALQGIPEDKQMMFSK